MNRTLQVTTEAPGRSSGPWWALATLGLLMGACSSSPDDAPTENAEQDKRMAEAACWLTHPASEERKGAIGVTETPSLGVPAHERARRRVVRQLAGALGAPEELSESVKESIRELGKDAGTVKVRGEPVYLRGFYDGFGHLYAYGIRSSEAAPDELYKACPERTRVRPGECEPGWICSPVRDGLAGFVGVSYRAATTARQYSLALENAVTMIEYAYGVNVKGSERYIQRDNGVGVLRFRTRSFDVDQGGELPAEVEAYVRELRYHKGRLYVWLVSPDLPVYPAPADRSWIREPQQNGISGAVGTAGRTADTLLSSQIQRAVDKGAYELAKIKGIQVDSEEQLKRSGIGKYYIQDVETEVRTSINLRVLGIDLDNDGLVHVWVAPAN